jgi:thiol-disulfide isomerase/thioredoxin
MIKSVVCGFYFFISCLSIAQSITGKLTQLGNQTIKLEGFNGLITYPISSAIIDRQGCFKLSYSKTDYGVGYLKSADETPLFVILSGEEIEIIGETLSPESIKITKGQENRLFEKYATEHPRREQALSAWIYLEKIYTQDSLFALQKRSSKNIQTEKERIKNEDLVFLEKLPKDSYVRWFLPTRKLVSSASTVAQYRPEEIPSTIAAFRTLDYADQRLYKSGLFKDAIESHFWLLENSGNTLDTVLIEMKISIDSLVSNILKDEQKLNEVTDFLFDLLERHSLFQASEYLAIKILNETSCTINSDLANQLETYRAMKKGNVAPEINFSDGGSYLNGMKQSQFNNLSSLQTPYTVVVFGASWCPKCMEELPRLKLNYKKWRSLGLEVVYISLDTDQSAFEQAVKAYPFFAYCDYKKWESQVAKNYYVFGTPTFYLLDTNREIILRPSTIAQLDAWVDWYLVAGNK